MNATDLLKYLSDHPDNDVAIVCNGQIKTFTASNLYLHEFDQTVLIDIDGNFYKKRMTDGIPGIDESKSESE